ncbi:MAG: glycosyltransferase, partial [Pedobacter sp.]
VMLSNDKRGIINNLKKHLHLIDYAWISRPMLNLKYRKHIKSNKKIRIIFDTVDLHFVRMLRQAESEGNEKLRRKAIKFKKLELELANTADATVMVTETERELLESERIRNVFVIPNIHELKIPAQDLGFSERQGLVFIGGYKHKPNIDAVKWLVNDILPLIKKSLGDIPVYLLGSYPPAEVIDLANENIKVPGYLEDVSDYFLEARIFVAPLRYGAGMKGKIGQSLEFGLPIVSTSIGAEGMDLTHEKNVLIADNAEDFANEIVRLYNDEKVWSGIRKNAFNAIAEYTPEVVEAKLRSMFKYLEAK